MAWADEMADGQKDLQADGAGVLVCAFRVQIPAIQGNGFSNLELVDGGTIDSENPTFTMLKSDIARLAPGKEFKSGTKIKVGGKTLYVKTVSFDPADPTTKITTAGETE